MDLNVCASTLQASESSLTPEAMTRAGSRYWVKYTVLAWIGIMAMFHLICAITGHSIYREIHLGTALEYSQGTINLLKPMIIGFNLNGVPTPQELPTWQALTALFFKSFGRWFGWANVVSLIFLFSSLYPLFKLSQKYGNREIAWWTLLFFVSQPLVFLFGGLGSPDGMSLSAAIWFLYFGLKLCERRSLVWLLLAIITAIWAVLSKLPFFMAAGLACFLMILTCYRKRMHAWIQLGIVGIITGCVFLIWTRYTNRLYALAQLPLVDLRMSNNEMGYWFFGDLKYRLNPAVWTKGGWRVLTTIFGSFALVGLFVLGLLSKQQGKLSFCWLLGCVLTTLVFFHVVLVHSHYYLMFAPAVAMVSAPLAARLERALVTVMSRRAWIARGTFLIALCLSTTQGLTSAHIIYHFDQYPHKIAAVIAQHTTPSDKLVIQGGGWGGSLLFLSHRKGLSVWNTQLLEDKQIYSKLKSAGFTKLVMVSESPLLAAIKHVTSTSPSMDRETYRITETQIVDTLPTVIKTEDILIKELP